MKLKGLKYVFCISASIIFPSLLITSCSTNVNDNKNHIHTIFHTNDVHGRLTESTAKYNEWMGLEKIATYTKNHKHDLLIDAGDLFQGLPISNLDNGQTATNISNYMGYDFKGIGNHEFDFGLDNLKKLTGLNTKDKNDINYLANNIKLKSDNSLLFKPYEITNLLDGTKIGVIGVATPETATKTHPKNITGIEFTNPINETKASVEELTKQGIDIIIAISHLGLDPTSEFTSEKLANEVDGLDIIIDGHSHTTLENGKIISKTGQPNNTFIAQTGSYTQNLGQINFELSDDKKSLKNVDISLINYKNIGVEADKKVQELIAPLQTQYDTYSKQEAFTFPANEEITLVAINNDGQNPVEETRNRETNLGDVFADALVYDANDRIKPSTQINTSSTDTTTTPSQIDFAFINGGSFRANITGTDLNGKKVVTNGDVDSTSPFGNTLEVVKLDSKTVWDIFEHSAKTKGAGSFLQVSKEIEVTYQIDSNDATGANNTVQSLKINGVEVNKEDTTKTYFAVTNDFLLAGGDGYSMLLNKSAGISGESVSESFKEFGKYLSTNENSSDASVKKWVDYKTQYPTNRIKFSNNTNI